MSIIADYNMPISIHAPARGATMCYFAHIKVFEFQSTLPRGERRANPTRESGNPINFNPRSREGSDSRRGAVYAPAHTFQSTLPRGERRCGRCF